MSIYITIPSVWPAHFHPQVLSIGLQLLNSNSFLATVVVRFTDIPAHRAIELFQFLHTWNHSIKEIRFIALPTSNFTIYVKYVAPPDLDAEGHEPPHYAQ